MQRYSDAHLQSLVCDLADAMIANQQRLVTAESCTGGWLAKCCTDLAGSSAWFLYGIISYSNDSKQHLLNVSAQTLSTFGAVSEQTAAEMAVGALKVPEASLSVAITGIAGPSGGSPDKPSGTVCFAWSDRTGTVTTATHHFSGNRDSVRRAAVATAIEGLLNCQHH